MGKEAPQPHQTSTRRDELICPACQKSLRVSNLPTPGARVRCPKCKAEFRYEPSAANAVSKENGKPQSNKRLLLILGTVAVLVIVFAAGWYFGRPKQGAMSLGEQDGRPGAVPAGGPAQAAPRVTPEQLLASLPKDKSPKPGPDGQPDRDAANEWLKANVAGKTVNVQFIVDDVEILDQGDGTHHANLRVTIDSKLDGPASLHEGVWGGDFKFNGIPYYIEYWGENPLWSGLSQADAEKLRGLKGKQVDFRCKTNDFEFQEGDDASQLKLVVTFADIKPPEDKPAPPPESPEMPAPDSPEAPLVATNPPADKRDRDSSPVEGTNENPPPARIGPPKEFASAGPAGVLQRDENPSSILDVAWSPNGRQVVAFDTGGSATLWDVTTSRGRDVSPTNEGPEAAGALRNRNRHVAFSPDGKTLVVGTSWKIAVIDLPAGKIRWETGAEFGMGPLVIDPGVKAVAVLVPNPDNNYGPMVSVRDIAKGTELFRGPPVEEKTPLALSPTGKLLAIEDGVKTKIRLFDVIARQELPGIIGVGYAADMMFSADGGRLLIPDVGQNSQIWDVSTPSRPSLVKKTPISQDGLLGKLRADKKYTTVSGDARTIASWTPEGKTVVLLDASTGATQTTLNSGAQGEYPPEISCVALNGDGSRTAIGTIGGTIVLRDAGQKTRSVPALATLRFTPPPEFEISAAELASPPERVWISPNGKWLITCGKTTVVWDLLARRQHLVIALDGQEIISNLPPELIKVWNKRTGNRPIPTPSNVSGWALRGEGRTLTVSVNQGHELLGREMVWNYDLTDLKPRTDYNDLRSYGLKSSPDGRYVASWQFKRTENQGTEYRPELVVLDAQSGKVKKSLGEIGLNGEINVKSKLAFSADSSLLAAEVNGVPRAGGAPGIKIWKWESGQEIPTTAEAPIKFLDVVDSGRLLVTGVELPGHVVFYDIQTGTRKHELDPSLGHASRVTMQAFSPVGPVFATGDEQGMLLIRDLATGAERARVQAHDKSVTAIGFSSNGQQLATCAADGEVKVWRVNDLLGTR